MSAEILRRAAALMRERAEAAPEQPQTDADVIGVWLNSRFHLTIPPAVALAVARWLDNVAHNHDSQSGGLLADAEDVARVYLGEPA